MYALQDPARIAAISGMTHPLGTFVAVSLDHEPVFYVVRQMKDSFVVGVGDDLSEALFTLPLPPPEDFS